MVESYTEVAICFISPVLSILNQKSKKQAANAVRVIGAVPQMGKLGPNTQNHELGYVEINLKVYTNDNSNEDLLKFEGNLRVNLYLL